MQTDEKNTLIQTRVHTHTHMVVVLLKFKVHGFLNLEKNSNKILQRDVEL